MTALTAAALGLPSAIQMLLAAGVGITVAIAGNKWIAYGIDGKILAEGSIDGAGELLNVGSKADALKSIDKLPANIQSKVKDFFKGGSNSYTNFTVETMANGNYMVKMTKPGNVPGSKAIYYKEISSDGNTIRVFKETFDPAGNLVHIKSK